MKEQRFEKIKGLVCEILEINVAEIKPDSRFKEDHAADSLRAIEILASLEKVFGLVIPQEELATMVNLNAVYDVCQRAGGWE